MKPNEGAHYLKPDVLEYILVLKITPKYKLICLFTKPLLQMSALFSSFQQNHESMAKSEEQFQSEVQAQSKLANLYKVNSDYCLQRGRVEREKLVRIGLKQASIK